MSPSSESNSSLVFVNGPAPQEFDRAKERASRVVDLFRDLSRYEHQCTMNDVRIRQSFQTMSQGYTRSRRPS